MSQGSRLSAAAYVPRPPRALTHDERRALLRIADTLIPDGASGPRPSGCADYGSFLGRALAARRDAFDAILALATTLADVPADGLEAELRRLSEDCDSAFQPLSAVLAGAYLMQPEVRSAIGYPGQAQRPPQFDQAAEEIMNGILEAAIERGPVWRAVD